MMRLSQRYLIVGVLGTCLLIPVIFCGQSASGLQQIAGKIEVQLVPGESKSVRWGLVSDSEEDLQLKLSSGGIGSEFLTIPPTASLATKETKYVDVMITIPETHPGGVTLVPYVQATQAGEAGQVVLNVGLRKYIQIVIEPNPDSALRTLQIKSYEYNVTIGGDEVVLTIDSTSNVSDFSMDYENRQISFNVSGLAGTNGTAMIPIGTALEGPYSVLIDNAPVAATQTSDDLGLTSISFQYGHSVHKVVVTGVAIVPEFPFPILGMIAGLLILTIALNSRILKFKKAR